MDKQELMAMAIRLANKNVENGGGPFGAVIAKNGEIVATGVNRVTPDCDPSITTRLRMPKYRPYAQPATSLARFLWKAVKFTLRANPAPCVWELYIGHI